MSTDLSTTAAEAAPSNAGADEYGKAYFINVAKNLLLEQHLRPGQNPDGEKATRFEAGVQEGKIETYIDVILNLPGYPEYDVAPATLRVMLLGQALTEYVETA